MAAFDLRPADEDRHLPGTDELWGESWYHDFAAADGSYGGYLRLGLYPNLEVAWCWVYVVRRGEPLVALLDHAAPCPSRDAPLDVRTDRLAMSWRCTEPLARWHVTANGTGVALADPADAFRGAHGPSVDVRVDLEWRGAAPVFPYQAMTRYEQAAWVEGEVVVGGERIAVRCPGERDHSWGVRDWWLLPWLWTSGRLDDGTWFHGVRTLIDELGDSNFQTGFVLDPSLREHEVARIAFTPHLDGDALLVDGDIDLDGRLSLHVTTELQAPILLEAKDGRRARFPRALSRFATPDGRTGRGWVELNWPDGWPR